MIDYENLIYPAIALIITNITTFIITKITYQKIKSSFFEFCDIPLAIKQAWQDDVVTKDEIMFVAKEIKEFADTLKKVK